MATKILLAKTDAINVAQIYRERLMKQAELAAKKELVSMSTAIDVAAAKGYDELQYRLSGSITKLTGDYYTTAMTIINEDILDAGYAVEPILGRNDMISGYNFSWSEEEEEETPEPEPVTPDPVVVTPTYTEIQEPDLEANPAQAGWYEKIGDNYVLTEDEEVDLDKTYYIKSE